MAESSPNIETEPDPNVKAIHLPPQLLPLFTGYDNFVEGVPLAWGDGLEGPAHEEAA